MLTYVDTRTGRVVDMPEAPDIEREWAQKARDARKVKDAERLEVHGAKLAAAARHTIEKMDDSDRWERVSDSREADRLRDAYRRRQRALRGLPIDSGDDTEPDDGGSDGEVSRPATNDPKADWIDWAVAAHGLDEDEAEAMTKNELMEL